MNVRTRLSRTLAVALTALTVLSISVPTTSEAVTKPPPGVIPDSAPRCPDAEARPPLDLRNVVTLRAWAARAWFNIAKSEVPSLDPTSLPETTTNEDYVAICVTAISAGPPTFGDGTATAEVSIIDHVGVRRMVARFDAIKYWLNLPWWVTTPSGNPPDLSMMRVLMPLGTTGAPSRWNEVSDGRSWAVKGSGSSPDGVLAISGNRWVPSDGNRLDNFVWVSSCGVSHGKIEFDGTAAVKFVPSPFVPSPNCWSPREPFTFGALRTGTWTLSDSTATLTMQAAPLPPAGEWKLVSLVQNGVAKTSPNGTIRIAGTTLSFSDGCNTRRVQVVSGASLLGVTSVIRTLKGCKSFVRTDPTSIFVDYSVFQFQRKESKLRLTSPTITAEFQRK